jgi:hypothetical protein
VEISNSKELGARPGCVELEAEVAFGVTPGVFAFAGILMAVAGEFVDHLALLSSMAVERGSIGKIAGTSVQIQCSLQVI